MPLHHIYRNGKRFDELDPKTHAVATMCRLWAIEDEGTEYEARDENGEAYYAFVVQPGSSVQVKNGPFTLGGERSETINGQQRRAFTP